VHSLTHSPKYNRRGSELFSLLTCIPVKAPDTTEDTDWSRQSITLWCRRVMDPVWLLDISPRLGHGPNRWRFIIQRPLKKRYLVRGTLFNTYIDIALQNVLILSWRQEFRQMCFNKSPIIIIDLKTTFLGPWVRTFVKKVLLQSKRVTQIERLDITCCYSWLPWRLQSEARVTCAGQLHPYMQFRPQVYGAKVDLNNSN
jgi:hypothetical protein